MAGNGFSLPLGENNRAVAAGMVGRDVQVGIRPEYLRDRPREGSGDTAPLRLTIELVETLGHEVLVHGHLGEDMVVAKVDPHQRPEIDTEIELQLELDKLQLFDAASEQRLNRGE